MNSEINKISIQFKLLKDNLTIILLFIYALSFIHYYIYYKYFDISIFNYISLNDMIFLIMEYSLSITFVIFITEVVLFFIYTIYYGLFEKYILSKRKSYRYYKHPYSNYKHRVEKVFSKAFTRTLSYFKISILFIGIFILPSLPFLYIIIPSYFIYLIILISKISDDSFKKDTRWPEFIFYSITGILVFSFLVNTMISAYEKRYKKDDFQISFSINSNLITTDKQISTYNYLGESSTYIFLFDIKEKKSLIFHKENIENLVIKNSNKIDYIVLRIKNSSFFKLFEKVYLK